MTEVAAALLDAAARFSLREAAAVALALAYLLLAIRQNRLCWVCAAASAGLYAVVLAEARLYMEAGLQVVYIAMAGYGWRQWTRGAADGGVLPITDWPPAFNVLPIGLVLLASVCSGTLLARFTDAAYPFLDSVTTWGALLATWMVARKVLQNWHYWFVIDALSLYLFWQRGLPLTTLLFAFYLVLIVVGLRTWRADLERGRGARAA